MVICNISASQIDDWITSKKTGAIYSVLQVYLQVSQREISEDVYRAGKLVVLQITEDTAFHHCNAGISVLIWISYQYIL